MMTFIIYARPRRDAMHVHALSAVRRSVSVLKKITNRSSKTFAFPKNPSGKLSTRIAASKLFSDVFESRPENTSNQPRSAKN